MLFHLISQQTTQDFFRELSVLTVDMYVIGKRIGVRYSGALNAVQFLSCNRSNRDLQPYTIVVYVPYMTWAIASAVAVDGANKWP